MEQIYAYLQRNQTNRDRTTIILINIFPNWVHQFYFPPYFSFNVHIKQETARKGRHFIMFCSKQYIFKGDGGGEEKMLISNISFNTYQPRMKKRQVSEIKVLYGLVSIFFFQKRKKRTPYFYYK